MRNTGLVCLQFFVMVLLSCGAGCAPWLSDDFDTYANGNLVGQGGWVGDVGALKVQAGFAQSGKAAEGKAEDKKAAAKAAARAQAKSDKAGAAE